MKSKTQWLYAISTVQFICMIFIVLLHYSYFLKQDYPTLSLLLSRINFVEFFFCCSGFVLHYTAIQKRLPPHPANVFFKQLRRLYPLHAGIILFFMVSIFITGSTNSLNDETMAGCVVPSLLLVHSFNVTNGLCMNYASWFLSAIFPLYLLYPVIFRIIRAGHAPWVLAFTVILIIALELNSDFGSDRHWTKWTYDFGVIRGLPLFLSGVLIAQYIDGIKKYVGSFPFSYSLLAICVLGMSVGLPPLIFNVLLQILLVAALAGAELDGQYSPLASRQLAMLGSLTFPLFLLHPPIASVFMNFVAIRGFHATGAMLLVSVGLTALCAVIAAYCYQWFAERCVSFWQKRSAKVQIFAGTQSAQ